MIQVIDNIFLKKLILKQSGSNKYIYIYLHLKRLWFIYLIPLVKCNYFLYNKTTQNLRELSQPQERLAPKFERNQEKICFVFHFKFRLSFFFEILEVVFHFEIFDVVFYFWIFLDPWTWRSVKGEGGGPFEHLTIC